MDDFQKIWAKNQPNLAELLADFRRAKQGAIQNSATKLGRHLLLEAMFVLGIFTLLTWAWRAGFIYNSRLTGLLILGGFLSTAPVFWRLGRAIGQFSNLDFTQKILENLRANIAQTRRELLIYRWSFYVFTILMSLIIWMEPFAWQKKLFLAGFMLIILFFGKYWIHWMYGRELIVLEKKLNLWESENADF